MKSTGPVTPINAGKMLNTRAPQRQDYIHRASARCAELTRPHVATPFDTEYPASPPTLGASFLSIDVEFVLCLISPSSATCFTLFPPQISLVSLQYRTPIIKLRERQSLPLAVRHQIFPRLREKQIRFPRSAQIAHAVARVEERWFLGVRDGQLRDGERVLADC